ncbi:MAG: Ig-like domain-containing protein [Acidimicrobiales bacterium]
MARVIGRTLHSTSRLGALACCLALIVLLGVQAPTSASAGVVSAKSASAMLHLGPSASQANIVPLSGHYPVAFILCDFDDWHYEPNSIAYYQKLWTQQNKAGVFSSLADYFHDVSFGQMDLKGSKVLGWFHMTVNPETWYEGGNGNRESVRWLDCVNAAEASGSVDFASLKYRALVAVTPSIEGKITGKGLAAEPALKPGQKRPAPETMTVDSTADWPPAPFLMSLPSTSAFPFGENVRVTKVSGHTLTLTRGFNEGVKQLPGPFAAVPPGGIAVVDSDDDFAYVGPVTVYSQEGAQSCTGLADTFCPKIFVTAPQGAMGYTTLKLGIANLFAGDDLHDGNVNAGVGDSAHEVGHTTGYNHSRVLSTSTTDYNDCYDQMSYNACGLPGFPGEAGPPDGVLNYDAINLEFHGWIPSKAIYNSADRPLKQTTLTLHALSDPNALHALGKSYLDVHIPSHVQIEDVSPNNVNPTIPPTCAGKGYHCVKSQYLTVEYRQRYGFDQSLQEESVNTACGAVAPAVGAVVLHLYAPDPNNNPGQNISYLVDSYPGKKARNGNPVFLPHCAALQPGDDYADPAHNTYVAVNSFDKSSFTATVTVGSSKLTPRLVYSGKLTSFQGQDATLAADLTVGGAPVPDQPVSFSLGGDHCGPVTTDASGYASCQVTDTLGVATWPVTASFAGDSVYNSASAKAAVAVWTPQGFQPQALTDRAPALAYYGGELFAAWLGATGDSIGYSAYNGSSWTPQAFVTWSGGAALTSAAPALAVFDGELYAAWTGKTGNKIYYSAYNGSSWSPQQTVSGSWGSALTNAKPALAVYDGRLYAGWKGKTSDRIGYSAFDGSSWAPQVLLSEKTDYAPAFVGDPSNGSLVIAWTTSSNRINYLYCCVVPVFTISQALTNEAPAMAFMGTDTLYVAWKGMTGDSVAYKASINGGGWTPQAFEPQALTDQGPALAVNGDTLYAGWKAKSANTVGFASANMPP